ncbi:hypothetical protein [Burkholderia glumae]|uniref:hypothetical protein n=1 Tax=Burkholderia glumae TaxID=337 RepID=UPI002151A13F|nr:hypothetical protein [Burkholderia glumae]
MTTIAMNPVSVTPDASSVAQSVGASISITAGLSLGDVLTGPSIPDGATIQNITMTCAGLDGARPSQIQFDVACGGKGLFQGATSPSYTSATRDGFEPTQASGQITVTVSRAPKTPAIGSVTLMVYYTPASGA